MWEINDNLNIKRSTVQDSPIFVIDNFYKNPEKIARFLFSRNAPLWKSHEKGTRNGRDFQDKRVVLDISTPVDKFLMDLCGQQIVDNTPLVITNQHRFKRNNYNTKYRSHYWWAHRDRGYNAIIYFNKDDGANGTNLYDPDTLNVFEINESVEPWLPKMYAKVIHTFESKFNRLVFFDGKKFPHGMAINNDRYHCDDFSQAHWSTYRSNQVYFYEPKCGN